MGFAAVFGRVEGFEIGMIRKGVYIMCIFFFRMCKFGLGRLCLLEEGLRISRKNYAVRESRIL